MDGAERPLGETMYTVFDTRTGKLEKSHTPETLDKRLNILPTDNSVVIKKWPEMKDDVETMSMLHYTKALRKTYGFTDEKPLSDYIEDNQQQSVGSSA